MDNGNDMIVFHIAKCDLSTIKGKVVEDNKSERNSQVYIVP